MEKNKRQPKCAFEWLNAGLRQDSIFPMSLRIHKCLLILHSKKERKILKKCWSSITALFIHPKSTQNEKHSEN